MINKAETLTWDFVQLVHELVLQLRKGLVLLAGARPGHVSGVGARRGGRGGGGLGRRQCFPSTLTHGGDAGEPGRCWGKWARRKRLDVFVRQSRGSALASSDDWVDPDRVNSCGISLSKRQLGSRMNLEQSYCTHCLKSRAEIEFTVTSWSKTAGNTAHSPSYHTTVFIQQVHLLCIQSVWQGKLCIAHVNGVCVCLHNFKTTSGQKENIK